MVEERGGNSVTREHLGGGGRGEEDVTIAYT
jgi:hypothetical protein